MKQAPMYVVRFITDFAMYAAEEQAAFSEAAAMKLQQLGRAQILGTVDEVAGPIRIPDPAALAAAVAVAEDVVETLAEADGAFKRGPGRPRKVLDAS